MLLKLKGWEFNGDYNEIISPQLVNVLENLFPAMNDGRAMQIMAQIRRGDGLKFGQVPELLERMKVPHEIE